MTELSNRILDLINKKNVSYGELSRLTGIPKSALQRYATGETTKIPTERLTLIAKALQISSSYLMGWEETTSISKPRKGVKIPVLGSVAAGIPIEAIEDIIDYEEITQEMAKTGEFFGLVINGDSMEPKFSKGDVVIVRQQPNIESGQIAVILINGNSATVKKFVKHEEGISLLSTNPAYSPMFFTPKEVKELPITVLGKVVELRAKFE